MLADLAVKWVGVCVECVCVWGGEAGQGGGELNQVLKKYKK